MKAFRIPLAAFAMASTLAVSPASAAPTEATRAGLTTVHLSTDFLGALTSLKVAPAAIAPGRLVKRHGDVRAAFPITTGAVDLGTIKAEIAHAGGLSLTAGQTRVELSSFLIDLAGSRPVLTGLVVANDSLLGRVPLFDLALGRGSVGGNEDFLKVEGVSVTLSEEAAGALNGVFGVTAFTRGFPIGTASVRSLLEIERH
jgi:hypothetical protein